MFFETEFQRSFTGLSLTFSHQKSDPKYFNWPPPTHGLRVRQKVRAAEIIPSEMRH